jgi:arginine repressor
VIKAIRRLLALDTAGDPMTGLKWTHRTPEKISEQLKQAEIDVSPKTVARLMKKIGYALRVNHKKKSIRRHYTVADLKSA